MKRFLIEVGFFCVLLVLVLSIVASLIMKYPLVGRIAGYDKDWLWIAQRIQQSQQDNLDEVAYLGDSVSAQIFRGRFQQNNLTTNGSVYCAGNYFLAANVLKNNDSVNKVVYASVPNVLGHKLERSRTYNYFVRPFLTSGNLEELNSSVRKTISSRPLSWLSIFPFVKILPLSDFDYEDGVEKPPELLSDVSIDYLRKMDAMCRKEGVDFVLVSPPVPLHWKAETDDWEKMKRQVDKQRLNSIFESYFDSIQYVEDEHFKDELHLDDEYLKTNGEAIVEKLNRFIFK